jgi:hypothetical protein
MYTTLLLLGHTWSSSYSFITVHALLHRGSTSVSTLALYYTAPLSTLARVVTTRNASSLHWPLCLMNVVNGCLWFAYGLVRPWGRCW